MHTKRCHFVEASLSPVQSLKADGRLRPKLTVLRAMLSLPGMPRLSCEYSKPRHYNARGSTNPRLTQELYSATDLALRATEVKARSLWKAMSTLVVQDHRLWLSLVELSDVDKVRFLDAPISQAGLFGDTVEDCVQPFSAVQKQTCHIFIPVCTGSGSGMQNPLANIHWHFLLKSEMIGAPK